MENIENIADENIINNENETEEIIDNNQSENELLNTNEIIVYNVFEKPFSEYTITESYSFMSFIILVFILIVSIFKR